MSILTQDFCNCNTTSQFLYSVPQPMSAGMTYAFSLSTYVTALLELVSQDLTVQLYYKGSCHSLGVETKNCRCWLVNTRKDILHPKCHHFTHVSI